MRFLSLACAASMAATLAPAQWLNYPTAGIPRTADGKANLSAPLPKKANGQPDLLGIWLVPGLKDDPNNFCLPSIIPEKIAVTSPWKIVETPGVTYVLYESRTIFRQIFTDGRPLPKDPNPTWQGYSIGHWEGDTFVVETNGFNGLGWLDTNGIRLRTHCA